jgi:hypothetical protein
MVKEDGPWEPGDEIDWPHQSNRYIESMVKGTVDAPNRVLALSRISQEWLSEMADMTMPFSDSERAMMSFIANTLVEGDPDQRIESMSCTLGDVQAAVGDIIRSDIQYDLDHMQFPPTDADPETFYRSIADQFVLDPRQPGLPLKQRIPTAAMIYERLEDVEFVVSNTSHGENVMMGKTPALPITRLNFRDNQTPSNSRATWFLGIFIHYTLLEKTVMDSFIGNIYGKMTVINRRFA